MSLFTSLRSGGWTLVTSRSFLPLLLVALALLLVGCTPGNIIRVRGWSGVSLGESRVFVGTVSGQVVAFNVNEEMELTGGTQAVWHFPPQGVEGLPGVYSTPVLEGDTLYIGEFRDEGRVYALDVETGVMRWQQSTEGRIVGAPVLAGELLLVGSEDGSLYAFQAEDGTRKWRFSTEGKVWSTPAVSGDTVYFGSMDHAIYAVSLEDGSLKWEYPTDGAVVSRPLVVDDLVVVGSADRTLYALDADSGALRWRFPSGGWLWAGAVSDGTTIYAPSLDGTLYALDLRGNLRWSFTSPDPFVSSPLLLSEGLVAVSEEGVLYLLSTPDLQEKWQLDLGADVRGVLAARGLVVVVGAMDGTLHAVDVGRFRRLWQVSTKE